MANRGNKLFQGKCTDNITPCSLAGIADFILYIGKHIQEERYVKLSIKTHAGGER